MAKANDRTKSPMTRDGGRRKSAKPASEVLEESPVAVANGVSEEPMIENEDQTTAIDAETHAKYEEVKRGDLHIKDLQKLDVHALHEIARTEGLTEYTGLTKAELIFKILKERIR